MLPSVSNITSLSPWLLIAGGTALGWVKNFWNWIYNHSIGQLIQRITVSVVVEEMDHAQAWIWLQFWAEKRLKARRISALMLRKSGTSSRYANAETDELQTGYELIPAYGSYPFLWRSYFLVFDSNEEKTQGGPSAVSSPMGGLFAPRRKIYLTIWGTRNRDLLLELISEAREEWDAAHPKALQYFFHRYSYWTSRPMPSRPRSTVYMPDGLIDDILADARKFLGSRARYEPMGIPWRKGYMFYGPPGGGKTTLVQAMATELNLPLYYLSLASLRSREDLSGLLDDVRPGSLVLIEDVDCITAAAERMSKDDDDDDEVSSGKKTTQATPQSAASSGDKITPSDLLNFIDGIIASQGRILVMTTNYPEKLDRALTRPGRVDRKWEITYAEKAQLLRFHAAAVANEMTDMPEEKFLSMLPSPATIADAQSLLFRGVFEEEPPCTLRR